MQPSCGRGFRPPQLSLREALRKRPLKKNKEKEKRTWDRVNGDLATLGKLKIHAVMNWRRGLKQRVPWTNAGGDPKRETNKIDPDVNWWHLISTVLQMLEVRSAFLAQGDAPPPHWLAVRGTLCHESEPQAKASGGGVEGKRPLRALFLSQFSVPNTGGVKVRTGSNNNQ